MGRICLNCFVSGRVQGVFYRRETREQGLARGLTGWVKNLPDGRVEVMICGEEKAAYDMQDWLWEGSNGAMVSDVEIEELDFQEFKTFEVKN